MTNAIVTVNGGTANLPTILGQGAPRLRTAGKIRAGIKVLTNERYARVDTSVTGQILKVLAVRPDAVLIGGSGTQGALPLLALGERGFKGKTYGTVALVNLSLIHI